MIGLYVAFFVSLCFSVNLLLDMGFYATTPFGARLTPQWKQGLFKCATVFLIFSLVFLTTFVLSLFWKVIQPFKKENHVCYLYPKIAFLVLDLIVGGIWSGATSTSFLHCLFLFTFFKALAILMLCSAFLLVFVYTKDNTQTFNGSKCSLTVIFYCLAFLFTFSMYVCPIFYAVTGTSAGPCVMAFLLPFFSFVIMFFLYYRGSRKEDSGFLMQGKVLLMMVVAMIVVVSVFSSVDYHCMTKGCQLGLPSNTRTKKRSLENAPRILGYQMCTKKWNYLKINDMVFFADLAYKTDYGLDNLTINANKYFISSRWKFERINANKPAFYHVRDDNVNPAVNVIGISGTKDIRDWVENGKIWNEVLIFQLLIALVPGSSLIPLSTKASYISFASPIDSIYEREDETYIEVLEKYLKTSDVQKKRQTEYFFLVGHSLGGGLAKIVGTRMKIEAIAFSSPGEMYNHIKYGYSLEDLQKYTTTFGSRDDVISWLDIPGGLVQKVRRDGDSLLSPLKTHSIKRTFCDIEEKCNFETKIPCD